MTVNYHGILTLEIIGFFTTVIYHGKLPWYLYNICPWNLKTHLCTKIPDSALLEAITLKSRA